MRSQLVPGFTRRTGKRVQQLVLSLGFALWIAQGATAGQGITYEVKIQARRPGTLIIRMVLPGVGDSKIRLCLPQGEKRPGRSGSGYFRNIKNFQVRSPRGELPFEKSRSSYWTIHPQGARTVHVSYEVSQAVTGKDRKQAILFLPMNSLLYWVGREDLSVRIRFSVPKGWKIASSLKSGKSSTWFEAKNSRELFQCPVLLGRVHSTDFKIKGVPFRLVFHERPRFEPRSVTSKLKKITQYQCSIFGVMPYDRYTFMVILDPNKKCYIGSDYASSSVYTLSQCNFEGDNLQRLSLLFARKLCRAWNSRFIHPKSRHQDLIARPDRTRSQWFTRGVSEYYAHLSLLKTGSMEEKEFFERAASHLQNVEQSVDYGKNSVSRISWTRGYGAMQHCSNRLSTTSYGFLLGLILDLEIRETTRGKRCLDDVMKFMGWWFGKKNTGFNDNVDLEKAVSAVAEQDYSDFFSKYIEGTEALPVDEVLARIGYEVSRRERTSPSCCDYVRHLSKIGLQIKTGLCSKLDHTSCMYAAGLRSGDRVITILGVNLKECKNLDSLSRALLSRWRNRKKKEVVKTVPISFRRDGKILKVSVKPPMSSRKIVTFSPKSGKSGSKPPYLRKWFAPFKNSR